MINKFLKLLKVSRPISWVNTAYPFAAGYLLLSGTIDTTFLVASLFFLIPYNILMYGINDVFDYESDIKNPRKGSIEGAVEAKSFHKTIVWSSILTTVPFVIALFFLLPLVAWLVLLVVLFFVIAYSAKPFRFKEIPFLDSISSSIHFVGPLVVAVAIAGFPTESWPFVIAFFLWGMASHAFGAVQDIIPDRKAKIASIGTVLGARTAVAFSLILYLASIAIIIVQENVGISIALAGVAYVLNILEFVKITDKKSAEANKGWKRFLWINYVVGIVVTLVVISQLNTI